MLKPNPELLRGADRIVEAVRRLAVGRDRPLLLAFDGGSGSGKSTLATLVAERLEAVMVPGDDFFAASVPDAEWERRTPSEKARDAIDWRRLRAEALEPLLAGERAEWYPFDFAAGARPDGTYAMRERVETREPASVIVLDGAYSTRPELADLIDLRVLVDAPLDVRHRRLSDREAAGFLAGWHARWDEAEAWYLSHVRPSSAFDVVVTNG